MKDVSDALHKHIRTQPQVIYSVTTFYTVFCSDHILLRRDVEITIHCAVNTSRKTTALLFLAPRDVTPLLPRCFLNTAAPFRSVCAARVVRVAVTIARRRYVARRTIAARLLFASRTVCSTVKRPVVFP
jgi:hypothetical protein